MCLSWCFNPGEMFMLFINLELKVECITTPWNYCVYSSGDTRNLCIILCDRKLLTTVKFWFQSPVIHAHAWTYTHVYTHTHTHTHTCIIQQTHTHSYTYNTHIHTRIIHAHTPTHADTHTRRHTHTYPPAEQRCVSGVAGPSVSGGYTWTPAGPTGGDGTGSDRK